MGNKFEMFNHREYGKIRTVAKDSNIWFVGKDITDSLGYKNSRKALSDHCRYVTKRDIPHPQSKTKLLEVNCIPEGDIYRLIVNSELPEAEKFEKWVFEEVLPSVRSHGTYMTPQTIEKALTNPDFIIELATQLKEEQKERELLEEKAKENKPKILFAEAVENSEDVILVKEMALILTQQGFEIGQNKLFEYLRSNGFLCKRKGDMYNLPTKRYEHFFKVTKRAIQHTGGTRIRNTPKITGKGQMYFINRFKEYMAEGLTVEDLLKEVS